jgi:threonine dehydrogenase-like Zn-dependent dehydrogenase
VRAAIIEKPGRVEVRELPDPAPGTRVVVDPVVHCGRCRACLEGKLSSCRALRLLGIDLPGGFGGLVAAPRGAVFPVPEELNVRDADPVAAVLGLTGGEGVDLAFEAVGSFADLPGRRPPVTSATESVRSGGRVLVLGQGNREQPVAWRPLVWKEAEIITSRVSRGEFPRAIALVASGRVPAGRLVTHEMGIAEAPRAFRMLDEGAHGVVKILLRHD